jgi:acyl CoA:acetate/3-ketoacid CoA transferase alpha subunit
MGMNKLQPDPRTALDGIVRDGMLLAIGGFGLCGMQAWTAEDWGYCSKDIK